MAGRPWPRKGRECEGDDVTAILEEGEIVNTRLIPWSSNYTFLVSLSYDGRDNFLAVYKPRKGERPLWDFPQGTLYRRERAAYLTSQALGWDFIPATVIRDGPHGVGSLQRFVPHDPDVRYRQFFRQHRDELARMALFDYVTNNADRKEIHCLKGDDGKIWGIDHGLTFNHVFKLRTVIWEFAGTPIPDDLVEQLMEFWTNSERVKALDAQLRRLIDRVELDAFHKRLQHVLEKPRFPDFRSRGVPWEFW